MHSTRLCAIVAVILASTCSYGAELQKKTLEAFNHYVAVTEQRINAEQGPGGTFLAIDAKPAAERQSAIDRMKNGEVVIDKIKTKESGKDIDVPDGLVHHWQGTVFIPKGTIKSVLALAQDYNNHSKAYAPEVERSKLIARNGNDFEIYYRLRRKKVITVVMDTYYDIRYGAVQGGRTTSRSYSTKIQEIEDPGEPSERAKPVDGGTGFMWRLNTYWTWLERDDGLYMQLEAVSLSRDIPALARPVIGKFVESVPRESLIFTLGRTRDQVMQNSRK